MGKLQAKMEDRLVEIHVRDVAAYDQIKTRLMDAAKNSKEHLRQELEIITREGRSYILEAFAEPLSGTKAIIGGYRLRPLSGGEN